MNERTQAAVAGLAEQAAPYFFGLHSGLPAEWNECGGGGYERFAIPAAASGTTRGKKSRSFSKSRSGARTIGGFSASGRTSERDGL